MRNRALLPRLPQKLAGGVTLTLCLAWTCTVFAYDGPWPTIFDWNVAPSAYGSYYNPSMDQYGFHDPITDPLRNRITPVPWPGMYFVWDDSRIFTCYDKVLEQQRPLAIYLDAGTFPLGNNPNATNKDPQALSKTMNYLSGLPAQSGAPNSQGRLDYVFMDFEPRWESIIDDNVAEAVRQVRNHPNPRINQAKLGNYDYYPCNDFSWIWYPGSTTPANASYFNTGVNVAQPSLYPNEVNERHTDAGLWGSNVAPNKRSALFWGPLAKLSAVKKQLPAGHELIPYINNMVQYNDDPYRADPPTREDNAASLQHYRLRGADSYYVWRTMTLEMEDGTPCTYNYTQQQNDEYRGDMLEAWTNLDWLFAGGGSSQILNLETDKTGGLQWSGTVTDRGVAVLVSNLGNDTTWFDMPDVGSYNDQLVDGFNIDPGTHRLEVFQTNTIPLALVDNGCPGTGLHSYTLTATSPGIMTLSKFTVDGEVHQVFNEGAQSDWLGDGSASESETTDSYVIFGDMRLPDLSGEPWDYDTYPDGPPGKVTLETITGGDNSGMGTLDNYDEIDIPIWDAYMKLGAPSDVEETVDLIQLVVPDGRGFSITLTLVTSENHDPLTGESTTTTHELTLSLPTLTTGDANGDGAVDSADASIMARHWLQESGATWADGDFNRDGAVNDIDVTMLAANWTGDTSSVPEPSSMMFLLTLVGPLAFMRSRKNSLQT